MTSGTGRGGGGIGMARWTPWEAQDIACGVTELGGRVGTVVQRGGAVHRSHGAPIIDLLLERLSDRGSPWSPAFIGRDDNGHQVLSYIPGDVLGPAPWPAWARSDACLAAMGLMVRKLHDLSAELVPDFPTGSDWYAPELVREPIEVICHNDLAPWNIVFRGELPVAAVDWDLAAPGPRIWDLAYVARTWVPLVGPEVSRMLGFDDPDDPPRRLRILADAYGLVEAAALLDTVLARQQAGLDGIRRRAEAGEAPYRRMWEKVRDEWPAQMLWVSENRSWLMSGFS